MFSCVILTIFRHCYPQDSRAEAKTIQQDLITIRKTTMLGNPLVLFAAKLRGFLDGARLARELLGGKLKSLTDNINQAGEIQPLASGGSAFGAVYRDRGVQLQIIGHCT